MKIFVFKILGYTFLVLGFIGVFLPLLPTTPFILLSLYFFSQSSEKMKNWILDHKWFGPPVKRWQERRSVSLKVKLSALGVLCCSMTLSLLVVKMSQIVQGVLVIIWLVLLVFIVRLKHET